MGIYSWDLGDLNQPTMPWFFATNGSFVSIKHWGFNQQKKRRWRRNWSLILIIIHIGSLTKKNVAFTTSKEWFDPNIYIDSEGFFVVRYCLVPSKSALSKKKLLKVKKQKTWDVLRTIHTSGHDIAPFCSTAESRIFQKKTSKLFIMTYYDHIQ